MLPVALAGMSQYRQFIVYKLVPQPDGKTAKYPIDWRTKQMPPKGSGAQSIWTDEASASASAAAWGDGHGVGFSFAESDPFWFLDVDNCLQSDNTWSPLAIELCQIFAGCAVEVSQSGRGLHIFGRGAVPPHGTRCPGLEFYTEGRFVALTGLHAQGDCNFDASHILPAFVAKYFPPSKVIEVSEEWTTEPDPEWCGPTDDDELIRRMLASKPSAASTFGNKATIAQLWNADVDALALNFPSSTGQPYDASSADMSLAMHLAYWTGGDCERSKRLMCKSALVRDKWEREDYLQNSISRACCSVSAVLQDKPLEPLKSKEVGATLVAGDTFVSVAQQLEIFKGCTYVQDIHKVLTPSGAILGPDQFKVAFGGYQFVMDNANGKAEQDAWKCFTQSRAIRFARADTTCFRPDWPAGKIEVVEGLSSVNTYVPIDVNKVKGDVSLFTNHVHKLLPDPRDAEILLSYMASCVQNIGVKAKWAPVIQGVEGNGKSLLIDIMCETIGRRYSHQPMATLISEKFNAWTFSNIFIGVNDIFDPHDGVDIIDVLKPMISEDYSAIRGMGTEQIMRRVCCNYMFTMNPVDGLKKTRNDRRYASLFCAQQNVEDLERDGMTAKYFNKLQKWLKKEGGYAKCAEFLSTYPIPEEFGLDWLLTRAPKTSSTEMAIQASLGRVELEIIERIESGAIGFSGGWISSHFLNLLINDLHAEVRYPRSKRRAIMQALGYDWHPSLENGRTSNPVQPDGTKSVLYIKYGHLAISLHTGAEITKAYSAAQMPSYSSGSNTAVFR